MSDTARFWAVATPAGSAGLRQPRVRRSRLHGFFVELVLDSRDCRLYDLTHPTECVPAGIAPVSLAVLADRIGLAFTLTPSSSGPVDALAQAVVLTAVLRCCRGRSRAGSRAAGLVAQAASLCVGATGRQSVPRGRRPLR
jgi:hypothetical protein